MRSGNRPSPEGTRLLFAGGTVSPVMCVQLMDNRRTTKKARRRTSQDEAETKQKKQE